MLVGFEGHKDGVKRLGLGCESSALLKGAELAGVDLGFESDL